MRQESVLYERKMVPHKVVEDALWGRQEALLVEKSTS